MLRSGFALFVLGLSVCALAGEAQEIYLQASQVNLRAKPSRRGKVVGQVSIGAPCTLMKKAKGGWVQVRCGETTGFTLGEFFGPAAPDFGALLKDAQDPAVKYDERFNAALRAVALKPDDPGAGQALRQTFLAVEFVNLQKAQDDTQIAPRQVEFPCPQGDAQACLLAHLSQVACDWFTVVPKGEDFLALFHWRDRLFVLGGTIYLTKPKLQIVAPLSKSYKAAESLLAVLRSDSKKADRITIYPLDPGSAALARKLPTHWYRLSGVPGDPHYLRGCQQGLYELSKHIAVSQSGLFDTAIIDEDRVQDSATYAILAIEKKGHRYTLLVRRLLFDQDKPVPLVVDHPLGGKHENMSHWKSEFGQGNFGVWEGDQTNLKQHFPIREEKDCPADDLEEGDSPT